VQGSSREDRELLDAQALVGHLVPAASVFGFLAEHRGSVFPDEAFSDLFPSRTGRPSIPSDVVGSVLVLQVLQDLSDRETVEALRCDIRWKVACGLPLTYEGFDPSTLVYWRRRLAKSDHPHRIREAIDQIIAATGVLKGKRRRIFDSTILADAVATQDTVTQLIAAVRRLGREVRGAGERIATECSAHDYTRPGKPKIDWDDPQARAWSCPPRRPRRSPCWLWWPGRTWNRPRDPMAPTAGGGSRDESPRTGSSPPSTRRRGTPASPRRPAGTDTGHT
jgi:hypothetical protein